MFSASETSAALIPASFARLLSSMWRLSEMLLLAADRGARSLRGASRMAAKGAAAISLVALSFRPMRNWRHDRAALHCRIVLPILAPTRAVLIAGATSC